MLSILSDLNVYGSDPELESEHCWVALIDEATCDRFFVLTICSKCGLLARKHNSNTYEFSKPSDDRWRMISLKECPGNLEEIT